MTKNYFTTTSTTGFDSVEYVYTPLLTMDVLHSLSLGQFLIELPSGIFLRYSTFDVDGGAVIPDREIAREIADDLLHRKFIELVADRLTEIEFEIQRALGLTDCMAKYQITLLGITETFRHDVVQEQEHKHGHVWTCTNPSDTSQWVPSVYPSSTIPKNYKYKGIIWNSGLV